MPPTAAQLRRILARLHSTRRSEQLNAIQALRGFAETPAAQVAVIEAGGLPALLEIIGNASGSGSEAVTEAALVR